MARETLIRIDRELFRLVATVEGSQLLYFASGKAIAVEKGDTFVDPAQTTMFVDFTGSCGHEASFVEAARRSAAAHGVKAVQCTSTPPVAS